MRVSLIPAEEPGVIDTRKGFRLFSIIAIVGIIVVALFTAAAWGKVYLNHRAISGIDAQLAQVQAQEAAIAPSYAAARTIQSQLKAISALLAGHKYVTNVFAFLEAHTLPTVAFTTLALTDDGKMTLTAEASDYTSLAAQVVEMRAAKQVVSVALSGITAAAGPAGLIEKVAFTLAVGLDPAIFNRK